MTITSSNLNDQQRAMLDGRQGRARQMGMRLLLDLAAIAGAEELTPIGSAHLSGVSPLTGGLGLRLFLARLAEDPGEGVAIPTTLNAAGCDEDQFGAMRIVVPGFLDHHREIIKSYAGLGVRTIQSCVPYEWDEVQPALSQNTPGAWAESNAICFANSYSDLRTNRESGLSALACALTGYAPNYGLLEDEGRRPNLAVTVTVDLDDPTDFSVLGDWIGKQRQPNWRMPFGPIPAIIGLPASMTHEQRKAMSAAAANYGSPLLHIIEGNTFPEAEYQDRLTFGQAELAQRYAELKPKTPVSLVVLGCPQASIGELKEIAGHLRGRRVTADPSAPGQPPPLWVFTSAITKAIAEHTGLADTIRTSGALLLENTCPEVVPYDPSWVSHVLTNSMKAEHYIKSSLNGIPTSVMPLADCIAAATGDIVLSEDEAHQTITIAHSKKSKTSRAESHSAPVKQRQVPPATTAAVGRGLPSQGDFTVVGEALVTDTPITFLGYVNRETGVIEEEDHPANGQSMAGKIVVFPRGTGSSVAPYVLLELYYRGIAPIAMVNTEIDQQMAPACSLEGIPYAYGFDTDVNKLVENGDEVALERRGDRVYLRVLKAGKFNV
jgi:predicted aconitase/predicted aconitase with swiveling domain